MNKSLLPNLRWLCLTSDEFGEDWRDKSQSIDEVLANAGMDLADESIFLLFDRPPGAILHKEGQCIIARSVIGPKRNFDPPFKLIDWVSGPVYKKFLSASTWTDVLEEAYTEWESLQREIKSISGHFMICLHRRLKPELELQIELIFSE